MLRELDCNQLGLDGQLMVPGQQAKMDIQEDIGKCTGRAYPGRFWVG